MKKDLKYLAIKERRIAKKKILQNFLNLEKEARRPMVAAVQKDNEEKIARIKETYKEIYKLNPAGGPLHIVLDDHNVDDGSILFCLKTIKHYEDKKLTPKENYDLKKYSTICAECLLELSYSKRVKLLKTM